MTPLQSSVRLVFGLAVVGYVLTLICSYGLILPAIRGAASPVPTAAYTHADQRKGQVVYLTRGQWWTRRLINAALVVGLVLLPVLAVVLERRYGVTLIWRWPSSYD